MNLDWSDIPSVVVGGLIATGAGWVQSILSRKGAREQAERDRVAQREQFDAQVKAKRDDDVRARADGKAEEILASLLDLDALLFKRIRIEGDLMPHDADERRAVKTVLARVEVASVYLQQPVRERVGEMLKFLPLVEELHYRGYMAQRPWGVGKRLVASTREALASYLRGEPIAPPTLEVAELGRLNDEMQRDLDAQFEAEMNATLPPQPDSSGEPD